MASKSKKRRRVLGASCILAALIIAGSSFAWFTSKDEVTNRLTATSDYGVSIVESFAPPKNWVPGEEVNKDVYAVNTGSVDAFVKETVSGILNYTYERTINTFSPDCVELKPQTAESIDGAVNNEAGGFLAWTSTDEALGVKNIASRPQDGSTGKWTPSKEGIYIFRRAIDTTVADATTGNRFTYAGYYFKPAGVDPTTEPAKYYKIVIKNDTYPVASTDTSTTPNTLVYDISAGSKDMYAANNSLVFDSETGVITSGTPKVEFVKEEEVKDAKVTFKYEDATTGADGHPARLVATFTADTPNSSSGVAYDVTALAAQAEVDYFDKLGKSNLAEREYNQIKADYDYALALAKARNALVAAANQRKADVAAYEGAHEALDTAGTNMDAAAVGTDGTSGLKTKKYTTNDISPLNITPIAYTTIVDSALQTNANINISDPDHASLPEVSKNLKKMQDAWGAMNTASTGYVDKVKKALDDLAGGTYTGAHADSSHLSDTNANTYLKNVKDELKNLRDKLVEYKEACAMLANSVDETAGGVFTAGTIMHIKNSTDTSKAEIQKYIDAVDAMLTDINGTGADSLTSLVNKYVDKYQAYGAYTTPTTGAEAVSAQAWADAITAYNDAVDKTSPEGARQKYETAISNVIAPSPAENYAENTAFNGVEHAKKLIDDYAFGDGSSSDPKIETTDSYKKYCDATQAEHDADNELTVQALTIAEPTTDVFTSTNSGDTTRLDNTKSVDNWKSAWDAAKKATDLSKQKYDDAAAVASSASTGTSYSTIKINVNLAEDYDDDWKFNGADGTTTQDAEFYLKSILAAGDTSGKLIDSVELDSSVNATSYKELTFDLNVGLDSAQVTYADDQKTVTTKAVDANDKFNMKATMQSNNTGVDWATPTP